MNEIEKFQAEVAENIASLRQDTDVQALSRIWLREITRHKYAYNFNWMGRPLIQFPQDMAAIQELVWQVRPDLIIEAGIAHGGSLIMSASLLALLDYCDAVEAGTPLDPRTSRRRVLGIDIDIRPHNRAAIEAHPMAHRISMIEGSSIAPEIIAKVHQAASGYSRVMVILDSNHTHDHVLAELEAYAPLTTKGSYCVVFDTLIEDLPDPVVPDRPWSKGNNPKTAVHEYLHRLKAEKRTALDGAPLALEIDTTIVSKLLITVAPDGYLRRV
ncbi:cephalosporin hydroxylase family protein [Dyella tabacisoli]|uniref:Cephalosporin hydroxylase n=1 Tax=Dyella tabacisoli TaxID=2282381 RepID=A0A369URX5_9GAMM|nr:cephalosporin hydroxylase family protein [Dyella tabacisoli]RDD82488.1 cephalosporin hydroxylase [Dyella tabacisoli]